MKKYRFFYHYNKVHKKISVHYRNKCHILNTLRCEVPCETKWNKRQPNLVMIGWASDLYIEEGIGVLL